MLLNNFLLLIRNIRIQDILDIVIIAIMISALLIWFKDRASRFVLAGIGLIGLVYILALFFQLYLTTVVLQGFFAIIVFLLVVIFQEDLRRFFERLAVWGRLKRDAVGPWSKNQTAEIIIETVETLARKRIGALIVIAGHDPLDRHLTGGTLLHGQLSQPLLESIFDPHSPGHDGAVVIQGNRVVRFGCRLPLAEHTASAANLGLRHTAALGLTERSDALCIVVSEERGTISLASGEELKIVSPETLAEALGSFYAQLTPPEQKGYLFSWLKENQREKVIAISLACLLWFIFGYQKEILRRDFTVPIDYKNISADWLLDEPKTAEAKVTLLGPAQAFRLLDAGNLKLVVDLSNLRRGLNEITLTKEMLNIPSNLSLAGISPGNIKINATKMTYIPANIEVMVENAPPPPYLVERVSVKPAKIMVRAPMKYQSGPLKIRTEPINLQKMTSTTKVVPKLILPPGVNFEAGSPPAVQVTIQIKKKKQR